MTKRPDTKPADLRADNVVTTPAYPLNEAAHYLNLPLTTLRTWCLGRSVHLDENTRWFKPLIRLDGDQRWTLSFLNLVEAHVLAAIWRTHRVPLSVIRCVLDYVAKRLRTARPLIKAQFQASGADLMVGRLGTLINVTREGRTEILDGLRQHLKRIERNDDGAPFRLFPFTRIDERGAPTPVIVIDPHVAFGRATLVGRAVPTAVLAGRFKAGDSLDQLAGDYDTSAQAIEQALRYELDRQAA